MYGAREGAYLTNCTDWDYSLVRDFDWLVNYFNNVVQPNITSTGTLSSLTISGNLTVNGQTTTIDTTVTTIEDPVILLASNQN